MTDLDALVAELREEQRYEESRQGEENSADIADRYRRAADAIEALRKDAERLDWLADWPDRFANIDRITSVNGKFNSLPTLRAAIDAAIAGKP